MFLIDASVVLKLVVAERLSDRAYTLVNKANRDRELVVAPTLLDFEITNAIFKYSRRSMLTLEQRRELAAIYEGLGIQLLPPAPISAAIEIALRYNLPAAYDAHYLALAEQLGCAFWTADERLVNTLRGALPWVRWLGEVALA